MSGAGRLGDRRRLLDRGRLSVHSVDAARALVGALLVVDEPSGPPTVIRLVETEAYREDDPASHSFAGRTGRTEVMFGPPGLAYVYLSYGVHWLLNVTCEPAGVGAAVLLRAGLVLNNQDVVRARRGRRAPTHDLARGPGVLARACGVGPELYGRDLLDPSSPLRLEDDGWRPSADDVLAAARTGVRRAADEHWRFHLRGCRAVSRYVRHPRAGDPRGDRRT